MTQQAESWQSSQFLWSRLWTSLFGEWFGEYRISQSMHNTKQNRDNSQTLESAKTKPKRVGIFSESPILYISEYASESETCWDLSGFCSSNFMFS